MAKSITITLTTAGINTGPFDLYSDVDSFTTPFETNISRANLLVGYTSNTVPDAATIIRVKSTGVCTNYDDENLPAPPAYNYYTLTPCAGGGGINYRSILSLGLGEVYTFLPYGEGEPDRACYTVTSITAPSNINDLPTVYGPVASGCESIYCQQL